VSDECGGDELFLALYKELTQRHLHSIARPAPKDRVEGWHVYCSLFDLILQHIAQIQTSGKNDGAIFLLPEWVFDILHEFVYQFQGFCQFRTTTFTNAAKYGPGGTNQDKQIPHHLAESMDVLSNNRNTWAVEKVLTYLQQFNHAAESTRVTSVQYLALFAAVAQARLECLLGDYTASLDALSLIQSTSNDVQLINPPRGAEDDAKPLTPAEVVDSVFAAKLNVAYHQGVCYLMLRRYKDASFVLGNICSTMQRGFKAGEYKSIPGSDQFGKLFDRMIALLAIITHACPETGLVEDGIARSIREKHGKQLSKIEAGEEGYEDLFIYACPKFITPSVPRYELASMEGAGAGAGPSNQDAYKLQVKHFMNEMANQQTMRKLRSYMKLYTSISLEKLGRLVMEEDFISLLLSYKHKMRQIESSTNSSGSGGKPSSGSGDESAASTSESVGTVMDIHYFINDGIIHVDEAEKLHRFENYFMSQISQSIDVMANIDSISVNI